MKIFISWSGDISKNTAEVLRKWIPCFFESVEVFFSPEDIEKGQNWNKRITEELANCNYCIVCLTSENKSASWLNFEAGAIAKTFDSRVAALLVDVNPSDIQGPLSMFQATKLVEDDIFKLIKSINNCLEQPRNEDTLNELFNALWAKIDQDLKDTVKNISTKPKTNEKTRQNDILESILQEVREQSRILSNPENFLPKEYLFMFTKNNDAMKVDISELVGYINSLLNIIDRMLMLDKSETRQTLNYLRFMEQIVGQIRNLIKYKNLIKFKERVDTMSCAISTRQFEILNSEKIEKEKKT